MQFLIDNLSNIITVVSIAAGIVFGYARLGGKVDNLLNNLEQRRQGVDKRIDDVERDMKKVEEEIRQRVATSDFREQGDKAWREREKIREELKELRQEYNKMDKKLGQIEVDQAHSLKILERLENHFFEKSK